MIVYNFHLQDHAKFISSKALKKFLGVFLRSGNINLIYDVVEVIHGSGHKIDQVTNFWEKLSYYDQ